MTARWTGEAWEIRPVTTSDNTYDTGTISIADGGVWQVVGPGAPGSRKFNPGGEMVLWRSKDQRERWETVPQMTQGSLRNHTYARAVVDGQPDFHAIWADGDARKPSGSTLYFCNRAGEVFALPETMDGERSTPPRVGGEGGASLSPTTAGSGRSWGGGLRRPRGGNRAINVAAATFIAHLLALWRGCSVG